ncbi:hypothetical protein ACVIU7_002756 [Bradyrhizobium liaoningense]|nr:hypothetical protein GCM10007858_59350 [Bradyrhizobium liaoningense]
MPPEETGATDGHLGAHIETLARAGYVAVDKAFVGKMPQTTVAATAAGHGAFARHVATLQEIIAGKQVWPPPSFRGAPSWARARNPFHRRRCRSMDSGFALARAPE